MKKFENMSVRFDTMHEMDRRTLQDDIDALCTASRGNSASECRIKMFRYFVTRCFCNKICFSFIIYNA